MRGVDLFAGWGGMTVGAAAAGMDVLWAANHWPLAVEAHKLNHPGTAHACQDLRQADWSALPEYDVLLAAPACQGHSTASQPKRRAYHDDLRATAYAVLDCAAVTAPYAIVVENVPEFRNWGPVGRPDGRLYRHWREGLELLGYDIEEHVLTATDFGVPQLRKRLFLVATMARFGKLDFQAPKAKRAPAFGPCIEWDAEGRWMRVADASAAIQARIAKGRRNHGAVLEPTRHGPPGREPRRADPHHHHEGPVEPRGRRALPRADGARARSRHGVPRRLPLARGHQ